ncbi:putative periplasmic folding chaperone [Campylobacter blaseri]|uniref:PpiC domain-containing protein n=1 Tax=Campylobacter blaseri TaxID=2042961 RepID=A0A2P8QZM7_9BACT|nr:peptidylprolyl isomerase [Campylobacter blaseri]PSM51706.1 hypothetical protein CQ405_06115 [Campylobacter blaseri]PSM53496.1 hypothetical protein CRN67_06115 [Campylobacter blaseri]QKF86301.1 putative periplasmic folding chaperone [Campylobacter blaseri]
MINWMQKNKKYLIPTIWVSTIAFVGAGFVGWGQYSLNKNKSTAVAKVGNTPITIKEFQQKYNNLYNFFSAIGGGMTQEQADSMNLEQIALNSSIQDTMRLNFAHDLGIGGSDKDIANYLISMSEFQRDGKFDEDLYKSSLANLRIKPVDFEKDLKKNIIADKLSHALNIPTNDKDLELLASAYFMQDRLSIDVIEVKPENITASMDEIKKYWQENKDKYKTIKSYDIDTYFISIDNVVVSDEDIKKYWEENKNQYISSDDKLMEFEEAKDKATKDYKFDAVKSDSLKKYLSLKKEEDSTTDKMSIFENDIEFPIENLKDKEVGEFIKPFIYKNGYLIAKISKVNEPKAMEFEKAKELAEADYKDQKAKDDLEKLAISSLENFKGKDIGFVSRDTTKSFDNISEGEFAIFLNELFSTNNKTKGYAKLENKAILYEITDQKLANAEIINENKSILEENAFSLKNNQLQQDLLNLLQKRYKVEYYYKGSNLE